MGTAARFPQPARDFWNSYRTAEGAEMAGLGHAEFLSEYRTGERTRIGTALSRPRVVTSASDIGRYIPPPLGEPQVISTIPNKPKASFSKTPRADMARRTPGPGPVYRPSEVAILAHAPAAGFGAADRPELYRGVVTPGPTGMGKPVLRSAPAFRFGTAPRF
jgi:hypothetical protein